MPSNRSTTHPKDPVFFRIGRAFGRLIRWFSEY